MRQLPRWPTARIARTHSSLVCLRPSQYYISQASSELIACLNAQGRARRPEERQWCDSGDDDRESIAKATKAAQFNKSYARVGLAWRAACLDSLAGSLAGSLYCSCSPVNSQLFATPNLQRPKASLQWALDHMTAPLKAASQRTVAPN